MANKNVIKIEIDGSDLKDILFAKLAHQTVIEKIFDSLKEKKEIDSNLNIKLFYELLRKSENTEFAPIMKALNFAAAIYVDEVKENNCKDEEFEKLKQENQQLRKTLAMVE